MIMGNFLSLKKILFIKIKLKATPKVYLSLG